MSGFRIRGAASLCAGLLSVTAGTGAAQSTTDTVYHLHGSVVNGVTGRPIGRALVVSADRRLATMTNAEGQFTLDVSVPPAAAAQSPPASISGFTAGLAIGFSGSASGPALIAQRPGYLPAWQAAPIALDDTASTRNLVLRLMPSATIRGTVAANGTEGLRGVRVQLLRRAVLDGRYSWQMVNSRGVAADGSFQMSDLQPGEYTVVTSEWSPRNLIGMGAASPTEEYPPDFLGDTRTLDGATKLQLGYGQAAQANLHLRAVPYFPVHVPVQGLQPGSGANVRVSAGTGFQLYQLGWNGRDAAVEGSLPDGDYTITVMATGAARAGARIPLHVAGAAVMHAPVGLTPTQEIPVTVRDERTQGSGVNVTSTTGSGAERAPGFYLAVRPEDMESSGGGMMQNTADGTVLQNMMPGRYYLQGNAMGRGYIASLTCDGVNLLTDPLVVNDSGRTAPLEATLRDDSGTISGTVNLRDSSISTARVLLLPKDGSGHVLYSFASNAGGSFQVNNVPPGSYRVFAMAADGIETLPFRDAPAMRAYDGKGGLVSVSAGQTAQVQVDLISAEGAGGRP